MEDEQELLSGFLDWQRAVVEKKLDGLPLESAARIMTTSGLSPLGVVQHLAHVERNWFRRVFAGEDVVRIRTDDDNSVEFVLKPGTTVESVLALYRDECGRARRVVAAAPSLDVMSAQPSRLFGPVSLRWILVHMIEETARHAGHLDLMCEELVTSTGRRRKLRLLRGDGRQSRRRRSRTGD